MIKMKRTFFISILLFVFGLPLFAQHITDVRFEPFGQAIRVRYTLNRLPFDSYATLNLFVSTDGGENFIGPLVRVQGDIGKVTGNGDKYVIWQAMEEMKQLDGEVVFELRGDVVKEKVRSEHVVMYNLSGSSGFGLMYGIVGRWGGYVRAKSNFSFADAPYTCNKSGAFNYTSNDNYYVLDGKSKRSRFGVTGGVLFRPIDWLYLYGGAGYGFRRLMGHAAKYNNQSGQSEGDMWAVNTDSSAEGVEAELGGIVRYKKWALSLGVNSIDFSFVELNVAIGLFF